MPWQREFGARRVVAAGLRVGSFASRWVARAYQPLYLSTAHVYQCICVAALLRDGSGAAAPPPLPPLAPSRRRRRLHVPSSAHHLRAGLSNRIHSTTVVGRSNNAARGQRGWVLGGAAGVPGEEPPGAVHHQLCVDGYHGQHAAGRWRITRHGALQRASKGGAAWLGGTSAARMRPPLAAPTPLALCRRTPLVRWRTLWASHRRCS